MTIVTLKEFGTYKGFDEKGKAWIYEMKNSLYKIDKNGVKKI